MLRHSLLALVVLSTGCLANSDEPGEQVGRVEQDWTATACGTSLASFDGTTAHSNGKYTGTGTSCAGAGAYGYQYQCVELVQRH
ncbi:MAG: hypothetical protein ACXWUG_12030, partial [Polyangiales bacterium]